jgi:hypothetical protein
MKKALTVLAALGLVLAVSSGAIAAKGLLTGADIKNGSLSGADIATHSLGAGLFTASARESLAGSGPRGKAGTDGAAGLIGANGATGLDGAKGAPGSTGASGTSGATGTTGATGSSGSSGTNGTNGTNGTVTPIAATGALTGIPTGAAFVTVASLTVPAGRYVVLAKTQIAQTGAGDSVDCTLKAAATTLDQSSMKTLPALAAVTVPLQAVTTVVSSTLLTVQCNVEVANGTANFSSLIAIPTN